MKKTRTHKLQYKPEFKFILLGISSHENDYFLCYNLNQDLGYKFIKSEDLVVYNPRLKEDMNFSVYTFEDAGTLLLFNLISNLSPSGYLFPELKNIDFFLQVYGDESEQFRHTLMKKLTGIKIINACFMIDPETLKSPERILFN